jgi:hypothetical protein
MPILFPWKFRQNREELLDLKEHLCYPGIVNASFYPGTVGAFFHAYLHPGASGLPVRFYFEPEVEYRPLHHGE